MTKWFDIFLWFWIGTMALAAICLSILGVRKVGLGGSILHPGWLEEFDPVDRMILKVAGYALLAGFTSLAVYFVFSIL